MLKVGTALVWVKRSIVADNQLAIKAIPMQSCELTIDSKGNFNGFHGIRADNGEAISFSPLSARVIRMQFDSGFELSCDWRPENEKSPPQPNVMEGGQA